MLEPGPACRFNPAPSPAQATRPRCSARPGRCLAHLTSDQAGRLTSVECGTQFRSFLGGEQPRTSLGQVMIDIEHNS